MILFAQMEDDVEVELELEKQLALAHELFPANFRKVGTGTSKHFKGIVVVFQGFTFVRFFLAMLNFIFARYPDIVLQHASSCSGTFKQPCTVKTWLFRRQEGEK